MLESEDHLLANTMSDPHRVTPHNNGHAEVDGGRMSANLSKASWNVIRLRVGKN